MILRLVHCFVVMVVLSSTVLALSGGWANPWVWSYLLLLTALMALGLCLIDDDLAQERFRPPSPGADRVHLAIIRLLALAHILVGALDAGRWHLAPMAPGWRVVGMVGMAVFMVMFFHAMRANPFFSAVVRIQDDRGHRVVDQGPYARVRHPGYAGLIPVMAFSGLALGSGIAFVLGVVFGGLVVRRVIFEDAFLHANLSGYRDYARRVPYRLLPGVW